MKNATDIHEIELKSGRTLQRDGENWHLHLSGRRIRALTGDELEILEGVMLSVSMSSKNETELPVVHDQQIAKIAVKPFVLAAIAQNGDLKNAANEAEVLLVKPKDGGHEVLVGFYAEDDTLPWRELRLAMTTEQLNEALSAHTTESSMGEAKRLQIRPRMV